MNRKYIIGITALLVTTSVVLFATDGDWLTNLHIKVHDFGFCNCDAAASFVDKNDTKAAACANNSSCSVNTETNSASYTPDEQKVISYITDQVETKGTVQFDAMEIENALGVSMENMNAGKLRTGVIAELNKRDFTLSGLDGQACGNCSKFSACSVNRDLSGASGEELQRYSFEKSQDGETFTDWTAPNFTLPTTDGRNISLSDYYGKPVVLVFLSGHCSHSFDTLPILNDLHKKYATTNLEILPVYVNSGSVEDILSWSAEMNLSLPFIVSEDKTVSEAYKSRMVPSTFFLDRNGQVTKKFVGYKEKRILDIAMAQLLQGNS